MQVVIKKSILFNLLKKSLNENRTGHSFYSDGSFLGRFDDPEEENDFLNSDEPVRASPTSRTQLYQSNFNVSDPDFTPASKSGFLGAAAAVLEHVPDNQIEYAYEQLHKLLDNTIEKEDERNYGSLKETFLRLMLEAKKLQLESADMRDKLIQNAAMKASKGDDARELADSLVQNYPEFDADDPYDLAQIIDDAALSLSGFDLDSLKPEETDVIQSNAPKIDDTSSLNTKLPSDETQKTSVKWEDYDFDDIAAIAGSALKKATNKEQFVLGYNDASKDTTDLTKKEKRDTTGMDPDYAEGYQLGYEEFSSEVKPYFESSDDDDKRPSPKELMKQQEAAIKFDRDKWREQDLPEVLVLIPELYQIVKEIGFKLEVDRYNLMMAGDPIEQANKNIRQVFNIGHLESFIIWNMKKPYFTKDFALKSMNKHLKVIFDNTHRTKETIIFKKAFTDAFATDGLSRQQGLDLLSLNFVEKILNDVSMYDYEADEDKKLLEILINTFASVTVYRTGTAAGPGGSERSKAKPYQGNNSGTFSRHVKEEYREEIISDYLDKLTDKYLGKDTYRIPSGRKDPENPKRLEYYEVDPIDLKTKATDYANKTINSALAAQAAGLSKDVLEDNPENDILGDEYSPDPMTDEEISEKLSNTKDFQTLAPFFGFSGAPGMRQWFLKFAKRFFEMGIVSSKSGDRTLLKFHSEMVEAVLETLSEMLPELALTMEKEAESIDNKSSSSDDQKKLMITKVLRSCAEQTSEAFQTFLDVGDDLTSIVVSAKNNQGKVVPMPFLKTLGGQLARTVNGTFFKKVMTKLDKSWTDYVAGQLQTNKQFKTYIADNIAKSASIDVKAARSVAEYFIGKKNEPEVLSNRDGTGRVYKSAAEGKPTKGVKILLKYGIDASAYHIIRQESRDWFEDMLMTDFAKVVDFEGQYRQMILKDYAKLGKNMDEFRGVILKALRDVITGSEERMAMDNLSDYEVED